MKIIYDSAVKDKLPTEDKAVLESVIPKLVAFKSLMTLRNIQLRKAEELKKVKEKKAKNDALIKANPKLLNPKKQPARTASKSPGKSPGKSKSPDKSKSPGKGKKKKEEEVEEVVEEKDPL